MPQSHWGLFFLSSKTALLQTVFASAVEECCKQSKGGCRLGEECGGFEVGGNFGSLLQTSGSLTGCDVGPCRLSLCLHSFWLNWMQCCLQFCPRMLD